MEPVERDYTNVALDDFIKINPDALKDIVKPMRRRPVSQQWRLGRNAPRPLKRLGRSGPLRPLRLEQHRANDGLPKLVLKRYHRLPPGSVFHRVGWNPLYIAARQKVRQACCYVLRQRPKPWMFWGRRHYLPPWIRVNRQHRMWRPHNFQGGYRQHGMMRQTRLPNLSTQQLVKLQRARNQRNKWIWQQNRQVYQGEPYNSQQPNFNQPQSFDQQRVSGDPLSLSSDAAVRQYPIPRDQYMPPLDRNVRPPSPVGSIVSTLSTQVKNPFIRHNNQPTSFYSFARPGSQLSSQNPFASSSRGPVTNSDSVNLNSGFRPTPNATNVPCTQRFVNPRVDMRSNMYMTVE